MMINAISYMVIILWLFNRRFKYIQSRTEIRSLIMILANHSVMLLSNEFFKPNIMNTELFSGYPDSYTREIIIYRLIDMPLVSFFHIHSIICFMEIAKNTITKKRR